MPANVNEEHYVLYALIDPFEWDTRYVGITSKSVLTRLKEHFKNGPSVNRAKYEWLQLLKQQGTRPVIEVLALGLTLQDAKAIEALAISGLRHDGVALLNITKGGDAIMAGRKHSPQTLALMSKRQRGLANHFFGRSHSDQTRVMISVKRKGKPSWSKGKRLSTGHRLALSKARMGKKPWNCGRTIVDKHGVRCLRILGVPQKAIAELFGVDQSVISRSLNGRRSSHRRPYVEERIYAN